MKVHEPPPPFDREQANVVAHIIREPSKSFAKSTCALKADRRWAVTGTPIQNRLMDLFSLFKFLRCSPFDDLKVFNNQVTQKWKARSDPGSVAKLKSLVNCLSLRRPKTTIDLLPRRDDIIYLDFNEPEKEDYRQVKIRTIDSIESGSRENGGAALLNTLKWVSELRLICNHGKRNPEEIQTAERPEPSWSIQQAQERFDQLDELGLAKCSNPSCCQDLSSALSSETGAEHDYEPWIDESLELWCCLCFDAQTRISTKVYKICNHLPRLFQKAVTSANQSRSPPKTSFSALSGQELLTTIDDLPTKVRRLVQDLIEIGDDIKRFVFRIVHFTDNESC